jgi:hypothetical protein
MLVNYRMTERQLEEYCKTGLLAVIEKLRRQLAAVINNCVQGVDWLKKELAFERFARETLAAELANCQKKGSPVFLTTHRSHRKMRSLVSGEYLDRSICKISRLGRNKMMLNNKA